MGQTKHVTSEAITDLAKDLEKKVHDQIVAAKQAVDECEVGPPWFGILGFPLTMGYGRCLDDFRTYFDTLNNKLNDVSSTLRTTVAPAWQQSEDNNTVRYGDA
jgi:hypothetical protein